MIAVVQTGGKQYIVEEQAQLAFEKLPGSVGDTVKFDRVLLLADTAGTNVQLGKPQVAQATVTGVITAQDKQDKVMTVKFHNKTRYRRRKGHRQPYTKVKITTIGPR